MNWAALFLEPPASRFLGTRGHLFPAVVPPVWDCLPISRVQLEESVGLRYVHSPVSATPQTPSRVKTHPLHTLETSRLL